MDVDKYALRLKNLKRKRVSLAVKNRKEVNREDELSQKSQKPAVYSLNEDKNSDGKGESGREKGDAHDRRWDYSMRDYEQWDDRENRKKRTDFGQYRDLAKATYDKEVQRIAHRFDDHHSSNKVGKQTRNFNSKGKIVIEDNLQLVSDLAESLEKDANQRYAKTQKKLERRNGTETSSSTGFVNEKNKQFNEKLDRQAKRLEQLEEAQEQGQG
ncbi:LAFA_0D06832g1_1 [Lachancea sp. 'fantastica']|nr:LAFA_0D06832g1_1 [Lachancea sp. 'fantastica']